MKFPRLQVLAVVFAACFIGPAVSAGLGEGCASYDDCKHLGESQVKCERNICSCVPTAYVAANMCVARKLGAPCSVKEECIVAEGSSAQPECKDKICSCPSDHKVSEDKTKCNSGVKNTLSILSIVVFTALAKIIS